MKKLGRKALALSLTVVMGTSMLLTGCGSGSSDGVRKYSMHWLLF